MPTPTERDLIARIEYLTLNQADAADVAELAELIARLDAVRAATPITITHTWGWLDGRPTIYDALKARLGREPTHREQCDEVARILDAARAERMKGGQYHGDLAQAGPSRRFHCRRLRHWRNGLRLPHIPTCRARQAPPG